MGAEIPIALSRNCLAFASSELSVIWSTADTAQSVDAALGASTGSVGVLVGLRAVRRYATWYVMVWYGMVLIVIWKRSNSAG